MKRLLAYLFVVLGLGIYFNDHVQAKNYCIPKKVEYVFQSIYIFKDCYVYHKKVDLDTFVEFALTHPLQTVGIDKESPLLMEENLKWLKKYLKENNISSSKLKKSIKRFKIANSKSSQTQKVAKKKSENLYIERILTKQEKLDIAKGKIKIYKCSSSTGTHFQKDGCIGDYYKKELLTNKGLLNVYLLRDYTNTQIAKAEPSQTQDGLDEFICLKRRGSDFKLSHFVASQSPEYFIEKNVCENVISKNNNRENFDLVAAFMKQKNNGVMPMEANLSKKLAKIYFPETPNSIAKVEPSQTQKVVETVSLKLNKNEVDAIFSSVNSCWSIPLGLPYNQDLSVKIKVKFDPSGNAIRTEIIDFAKINKKGNAYLKVLAESALRAIKLCSPIRAPKDKYDLWKEVVFNFDAKDVLNGTESKDTKIAKNNLLKKYTETQIAKAEPTVTPKKKVKVAKVKEPKQEEFKPENKDNEAPIIEIAEAITVNDSTYEIEGKVIDKSKKLFVQIDGETIPVKKGKFKIKRFSPVDEQLKIVALDQWGNKSKPKLVNITIDLKETELAEKLEQLNPSLIKSRSNKNRVALIIGIEKYEQTPSANFANLDAQYFYEYARKGFGIPKSNIKLLVDEDADLVKSISSINKWLPSKIKKNKTELIIFFAGHGLASNNGQELYILPQDSDPDLLSRTALSRTELFEQIISLSPKSVTMFMDTCYSGISRDEKMLLASARPIRIVADDQEGIPDNFTIFTASKLDQISSGLEEAKHGIFSYYLMKGLEGKADSNQDKKITNGELLAYMDENVSQKAAELGREQNPSLAGDPDKVLMSYR